MEKPNFKMGMTSIEALVEIVRVNLNEPLFLKGEFIWFYTYAPRKNTQDRKVNSLSQLIFHDYSKSLVTGVKSELITVDHLNITIRLLKKGSVLGVISEVKKAFSFTDYRTYHIPMVDFNCPKNSENLSRIEEFLRIIGQEKGIILDSGRSYHYYGVNLIDEKKWLGFLGDCLLSEFVDKRYIGHRLKDRCGILRLSASPLRPKVPTVLSIL